MTNMEGVGMLFMLLLFGVPLLILAIIAGYYFHRHNLKKGDSDREYAEEMPLVSRETLRLFLLRPDEFFRHLTACRTGLYRPFILIIAGGLVFDIGYIFMVEPVTLSGGPVNFLVLTLGTLPLVVIVFLTAWFVLAALLYAISALFRGTGPFAATLQNTGYGVAFYLAMTGLILIVCSLILGLVRQVPGYTLLGYPPYQQPVTVLIAVITTCTLVWTAWYWSYGLGHARKIPLKDAAKAMYGLVIVYLGVTYLPPLMAFIGNQ